MAEAFAAELVARSRQEIVAAASENRFLELLEVGAVPRERLAWLAGEEYRIVGSDRRSFSLLAARYPEPPAGGLFLALAQGEGEALALLLDFAAAIGISEKDLSAYEPKPLAQAYPAYLAQRAMFGTASEVALAMLANLEEWGAYCARAAEALRSRYGMDEEAVGFFRFFAEPPPGFADHATEVIAAGLAAGDSPDEAVRAARMLHAYESHFWAALAEDLA
ncbi:thiaminase II/PqqC family protein [Actinomadura rudentiformis]|uniref:Transcriptional regulator n=1 Tax=Actinomadura rudentiformis TaxID=359158 RepID=A0A6H9YZF0_9ACTN|nr:transcriptional regulator [Actinomadura rudentiformis]KAB2346819.1 transcriptional regulator [Actinomadura rudentiformis]